MSTSRETWPNPSPWSRRARFRYYRNMRRHFRACLGTLLLLLLPAGFHASAQAQDPATAPLREVHADGEKFLTEAQVVAITGLLSGAQIGRNDLQTAADRLGPSGLFAQVTFTLQTTAAGIPATNPTEE